MKCLRILFLISKSEKRSLANGKTSIYGRIRINDTLREFHTEHHINASEWSQERQKLKTKGEAANIINESLERYTLAIRDIYNKLLSNHSHDQITAKMIMDKYKGREEKPKEHSILEAYKYHNRMFESQREEGASKSTVLHYQISLSRLESFIKDECKATDLPLSMVTYGLAERYNAYMISKFKCKLATTQKYIKHLKKVMRLAVREGWINHSPINDFSVKPEPFKRDALTVDELHSIENLKLDIERLRITRDIFVFSCYTGLAYSDVEKLTPEQISLNLDGQKFISVERNKTKEPSLIPLLPKALQIIDTYKNHEMCLGRGKLLPVYSNQHINGYLKEIATLAGITKNLQHHLARHTCATMLLNFGVPITTVQNILGHSSVKTTEIYAKLSSQKVFQDIKQVGELLTRQAQ